MKGGYVLNDFMSNITKRIFSNPAQPKLLLKPSFTKLICLFLDRPKYVL